MVSKRQKSGQVFVLVLVLLNGHRVVSTHISSFFLTTDILDDTDWGKKQESVDHGDISR
jgi:hypothetical protein